MIVEPSEAASAQPGPARDIRVCFLGDSFTAGVGDPTRLGWVGRLAASADPHATSLTVYNLGIRRDTSRQIHARWKAECLPRLPDTVDGRLVLSFGVNDMTRHGAGLRVDPRTSAETLRTLLTEAAPGLPVLVVGPPPGLDPERNPRLADLDARYADVCAAQEVPYVSVFDVLADEPRWRADLTAGDGVHPGADGYQVLADLVTAAWQRWLDSPGRAAAALHR